ncbi:hypothetical protein OB905_09835 [Halobacteria archaeon AArc-dxtr1]|nr:hypothetical protein [Halobacteria archaeon AArc-dxtr1]
MAFVSLALPDRLLVCTGDPDDTEHWNRADRLEGHRLECVTVSSDAPERVFAGTFESGLYRSADGGDTFERLETDFEPNAVTALAISPHDADVVYAGTEPSRVYRSTDGGNSWTHLDGITDLPSEPEWYFPPRPDTHHVRWIEVDPFDPDRLYVGIEAGAFVFSTDGGDTWQERPPGSRRDNHSLATHPDREGLVYTAAGDGFAASEDGGESWERPQKGLDHRYCWSVVPDPGNPDRVLVSSATGASTAHRADSADAYVYCRAGDEPWKRLDGGGLPTGEGVVRAEFVTTDQPAVVYGATNRGLFRSADFGDSWNPLEIDWDDEFERRTPRGLTVTDGEHDS